MRIYDKAQWHIDAGESESVVVSRFKAVFEFLNDKNLLTSDGMEIYEFGIDESVSLHEHLVNEAGKMLLDLHYDSIISLPPEEISTKLMNALNEMFL
jgi:hypothetical protein